MLYAQISGLGITPEGLLERGPDFTLNAQGSAVGANATTVALFKDLQREINRYARQAVFALLTVDGKLGGLSVNAMQRLATMFTSGPRGAQVAGAYRYFLSSPTVTTLAAYAARLLPDLRATADALAAGAGGVPSPAVAPPVPPIPGQEAQPVQEVQKKAPRGLIVLRRQKGFPTWAGYAIGAVGAGLIWFVGYSVYKRRQQES